MSNDTHKADQIAFHFYTKLFYVLNDARATSEPRTQPKVDKWFNLETPDSDLFTKEAREPYRNISLSTPPGPPPLEIQVLLSIPELTNNQVLVHIAPDSSRIRIEPTPRFVLLESWILAFTAHREGDDDSVDVALPTIYKHGIPLFRSLFSLLRVLPTWKLYKRLKRRTGGIVRNGHLGIQLRVRASSESEYNDTQIMSFDSRRLPSALPTQSYAFSAVPHPLGSLALSTTYLETPNFQLEELESLLSSRFMSLDLGFVPTLTKNHQRESITGSLPSSSGIRSAISRSPPKPIPDGGIDRFILPAVVSSTSLPRNTAIPMRPSLSASGNPNQGSVPPPSGLAVSRLRRESLNSSSSSDLPSMPYVNPSLSSLSSSPSSGPLPIRRPNINPVHPFKSNTISSASNSSPSLSIRQGVIGGGSPLSTSGHTRQTSSPAPRLPPSPIGGGFSNRPSPSSLGDKRPSTSGSGRRSESVGDRDRRASMTNFGGPGEGENRLPRRKRYSSSFGHRYVGSVGSVSTGADGSGSGRSTPAGVGLGSESSQRERTQSAVGSVTSFLSTTTDDDDISMFVQDIDSRKPLSGREKEREKRDKDGELRKQRRGEAQDMQSPDGSVGDTSAKGKERETPMRKGSSTGSSTARAWSGNSVDTDSSPPTSGFSPARRGSTSPQSSGLSTSPTSMAVQASTSPNRGPMLTSQGEVDERLRKMNETFMKSLEGFSGGAGGSGVRRKERTREPQDDDEERQNQRQSRRSNTVHESTPSRGRGASITIAGRGLGLVRARDADFMQRRGSPSPSPSRPYSPGRGMGLGRAQDGSLSSAGSDEVMGRMELYEERRRSGYQP